MYVCVFVFVCVCVCWNCSCFSIKNPTVFHMRMPSTLKERNLHLTEFCIHLKGYTKVKG